MKCHVVREEILLKLEVSSSGELSLELKELLAEGWTSGTQNLGTSWWSSKAKSLIWMLRSC